MFIYGRAGSWLLHGHSLVAAGGASPGSGPGGLVAACLAVERGLAGAPASAAAVRGRRSAAPGLVAGRPAGSPPIRD